MNFHVFSHFFAICPRNHLLVYWSVGGYNAIQADHDPLHKIAFQKKLDHTIFVKHHSVVQHPIPSLKTNIARKNGGFQ